jgi:hypothetical protein
MKINWISRKKLYRTTEYMQIKNLKAYRTILETVIQFYNRAGFRITIKDFDNEFQTIMKNIENIYGISMNYASSQEIVPEIERSS